MSGKSNHLFEPLTSIPTKGTNESNKIEIINNKGKYLIKNSFSCIEIKIRKNKEIKKKIRCLIKKKYVCLFIFSAITRDVEENEKKRPKENRKINKNKICLSTFLHHVATRPVFSLLKLNI